MANLLEIINNYSLESFVSDLILIGIAYLYVLATIMIPVFLKKKDKISKFVARKMVHLFAGLVVLIVPFFILPLYAIFIAGSLTIVVYFSSKDSSIKKLQELYETIGEEAEEEKGRLEGPFHYCISITLLVGIFVIFAPDQLYFPISGILIMIISDTLASLIGKNYGRVKMTIPYTKSERTLEGSLTFFVSAFLLCFLTFFLFGRAIALHQQVLTIELILIYSLVTALLGMFIEMFSPSTWDDLTVPIATTLIIFLLSFI